MVAPGQTLVAAPVRDAAPGTARSRGWWVAHGSLVVAPAVAGALAVLTILMRWRGSDLPAHFFRVGLVERDGLVGWNNYWFGGHHTLGYGVLFPVLGALVGIWTVAVASAVLSAFLVDILIRRAVGHPNWWASLWFAVGTMTNVAIGRLPFALGLVVALGALVAAQSRRLWLAGLLTVATAAASPVVSVFLLLIFAAWALTLEGRERRSFALLAVASMAPVLIVSKLYPQGGMFPFRWTALLWTLFVCLLVFVLVPVRHRLVRLVAVLYALASIGAFLVPTPLGANITRLGMYAAPPVLITLVPFTPVVAVAVLAPLVWWQWSPAFDAILRARDDPSIEAAYYRPLLNFFDSVGAQNTRVEVVPTARHWEAAFVANEIPIARGWERQLDRRFHPFFYDGSLTDSELHSWLRESGVRYVALADTALDDSGVEEAALIEADPPYLRPAWHDEHWRVWRVVDSTGLIDGPARLNDFGVDTVSLDVLAPGDVLVRVRASAFWSSTPPVCIEPTADGWIVLRDVQPGPLELKLDETALVDDDEDLCES
jgi:hypothetical protein